MKVRDLNELFEELGIELKYGCGIFRGKHVRYLRERGVFQVGDSDFDRWANSVDLEFDVWQPKGQRNLRRWAKGLLA